MILHNLKIFYYCLLLIFIIMKKFMINVLFMIKNREDRFSAALYDLLVGREKKMKAFFEYIESLSEEEARFLISSENYNMIFLGIQKGLFSSSCKLEILQKLIDKDDHNKIMLYLSVPQISLNQELSQKLILRNNHEEIMLAIKNACLSDGEYIYGFSEILERGNHDEIMAFLDYPKGILLTFKNSQDLLARNNEEEIRFAREKKILFGACENRQKDNEYDYISDCYGPLSCLDCPYNFPY